MSFWYGNINCGSTISGGTPSSLDWVQEEFVVPPGAPGYQHTFTLLLGTPHDIDEISVIINTNGDYAGTYDGTNRYWILSGATIIWKYTALSSASVHAGGFNLTPGDHIVVRYLKLIV